MIYLSSDYTEGAHPDILRRLVDTNLEQTTGYGTDPHCQSAADLIRKACSAPAADVHFLVGGTQANLTVIAAALRPHQGVLSAETGHIQSHESGAIEATGHRVIPLQSPLGKIDADSIDRFCQTHFDDPNREHAVKPAMVYLSHPTELGTLYSLDELKAIREVCTRHSLLLYLDGARLAYALASPQNDVTLPDLARHCDVFYIGGTKCGALFGEAVVISNESLKTDFRYIIKQRGGMLAKGRLLGLQFEAMFQNNLYFEIGRHAIALALKIRQAFSDKGVELLIDSETNQQFPILKQDQIDRIGREFAYTWWQEAGDDQSAIRFCTSWATRPEAVSRLVELIRVL